MARQERYRQDFYFINRKEEGEESQHPRDSRRHEEETRGAR